MECLNDVLLKIWNNINSYKSEEAKFTSWLIAVSKYNAIDYKRKLSKLKNNCDNVTFPFYKTLSQGAPLEIDLK